MRINKPEMEADVRMVSSTEGIVVHGPRDVDPAAAKAVASLNQLAALWPEFATLSSRSPQWDRVARLLDELEELCRQARRVVEAKLDAHSH